MIRFDPALSRRRFLQIGGGGALAFAAPGLVRAHLRPESNPFLDGNFAPTEGAQAEDDGWLMTFVFDSSNNRSEFVLIDARDPSVPPVAKFPLPCRVPYGFHGTWVPGVP